MEITVKVIGDPILTGKADTFVAATFGTVMVYQNPKTVGAWENIYGDRATVDSGIVTLTNSGHYRVKYWQEIPHTSTSPTMHGNTSVYHNGAVIISGGTASGKTVTFDANAGDTIQIRSYAAGTPGPLGLQAQFYYTAIIEKVPNEV